MLGNIQNNIDMAIELDYIEHHSFINLGKRMNKEILNPTGYDDRSRSCCGYLKEIKGSIWQA
jgi:hypothetical protein